MSLFNISTHLGRMDAKSFCRDGARLRFHHFFCTDVACNVSMNPHTLYRRSVLRLYDAHENVETRLIASLQTTTQNRTDVACNVSMNPHSLYRRSVLRLYNAHDCDSIIFSCTDVACNVSINPISLYRRSTLRLYDARENVQTRLIASLQTTTQNRTDVARNVSMNPHSLYRRSMLRLYDAHENVQTRLNLTPALRLRSVTEKKQ